MYYNLLTRELRQYNVRPARISVMIAHRPSSSPLGSRHCSEQCLRPMAMMEVRHENIVSVCHQCSHPFYLHPFFKDSAFLRI